MNSLIRDTIIQVDLQKTADFQQTFVRLCQENQQSVAAELATQLLLDQKEALLQPNPQRERYEFILKNLKAIFPDIKTHFSKDPQKLNSPMEGLNMHAISTKGQRVIINSYKHKNRLNGKNVVVSDNFSAFQNKLSDFLKKGKEGEEQLFLVRHRKDPQKFPKDLTRHTSPVHVRRKNNVFQFFLTDSQGGPSPERPIHAISDVRKRIMAAQTQSGSDKLMEINYDGGTGRLGDGNNCVILAIREGLEIIRNTDATYSWIEQTRIDNGDGTYAVPHLPIRMVKNAQSLTYITTYLNETGQHETTFTSPRKLNGETVSEAVKRHQFVGTDPRNPQIRKLCNGKVAHNYLKYERLIISHCILNHQNS